MQHPSSRCRWGIHALNISYDRILSPEPDEKDEFNVDDEDGWPSGHLWDTNQPSRKDSNRLLRATFLVLSMSKTPVSGGPGYQSYQALSRPSPRDAIGFAIMARNRNLSLDTSRR